MARPTLILGKTVLVLKLIAVSVCFYSEILIRSWKTNHLARRRLKAGTPIAKDKELQNIVVIGASFAGYHAAKLIAESLPVGSPYRVVVIEPNSHFQFTWLLPRFSVVNGHEQKLFIPYGPYIQHNSESIRWVKDRAISIGRDAVRLRDSPEEIPWKFLVVATGSSGQVHDLPSRVGAEEKEEGAKRLTELQDKIKGANNIVVVGGGAAGVEIAADANEMYPEKKVTLVHSRPALMHRFGSELQAASLKALTKSGIEVLLEERLVDAGATNGVAILKSGKEIECDLVINCTGQRPASDILKDLAPNALSRSGHVKVKSTLQIAEESLPGVYACGDVAETDSPTPNARSAMRQAIIAADNIILAISGQQPQHKYTPHWVEGVIKLTVGLYDSIINFGDGKFELLKHGKEKQITLMADQTWRAMGVNPSESAA